jgi:uncharacterized protein (DUF58 family)
MNRIFFLSLTAFLLTLTGLTSHDGRLLVLALPLLVFLFTALWMTPRSVNLKAQHTLSARRVYSGEEVLVRLKVWNEGKVIAEVLFEDILPDRLEVIDGSTRCLVRLAGGESKTWTYLMRGKRGYFRFTELHATIREPLGLIKVSQILDTDGELFIVPPVLRLRNISIRPRRTRIYSGTIPARQGGPGVEFYDVREYQAGDPPHAINWRLTARHQETIYANQYEQERVVDVGIILDGRRNVNEIGGWSIFEHSVLATASLADAFLAVGNRVGLLFYGKNNHWIIPGYGKYQGEKILQSLACLELGDSKEFNELYIPSRLFPTKSQLVFISPLIADDFKTLFELRAKGYAILVVKPDPVSFEISKLSKSESIIQAERIIRIKQHIFDNRLRNIGIQVVNWDISQSFEFVARRELERHQRIIRGGM